MRKLVTLQIIALLFTVPLMAQHGYVPEKLSGDLYLRDLTSPGNAVLKGTGPSQLGGADMDLNGILYGIDDSGGLHQIDTSDASSILIATITPPGSEFWTGMACDPTDGTMYLCSTDGSTNSYFTVDVTNGATTLIGTNTDEDGVVGIAFDNGGQMYAILLVGKFYKIDKSNATGTFVGNLSGSVRGLTHHGLDYDEDNEIMYLVSYNVFTMDNELCTVDLATGANTLVGSIGLWAGTIVVSPAFSAGFTSDVTEVCDGGVVNFTDQSTGAVTWSWTFEGGTPGTSTAQNPSVTYNTVGTWDVTLEISDGAGGTSTLAMTDYISVITAPGQAATPTGPDALCGGESANYITTVVAGADTYEWTVDPSDAGTISGTGTTGSFTAATDWSGTFTISVRGSNTCGDGAWSNALSATLYLAPQAFFLSGGGSFCEGGAGLEITLDGSEVSIDYELYHNGTATGNIVAGTGSPLSFGYVTEGGTYTAMGYNVNCSLQMSGQPYVVVLALPGLPTVPQGPDNVCNMETTLYTSISQDADTLIWSLDPQEAGVMEPGSGSVEITWSATYTGTATLYVYGGNECGDGETADLAITVNLTPEPEVSGLALVCEDDLADYQTADNAGSTYTWDVTGGTITAGAGTHMITVMWGSPGMGYISVTEDNGDCQGTSEEYEVTIDDCVGIDEFVEEEISVYPNPASSTLNIMLPGHERLSLRIVNMLGHIVVEYQELVRNSGETKINIENLETGIYFLHMMDTQGKTWIGKFIKAN